jgi:hypothetical protein
VTIARVPSAPIRSLKPGGVGPRRGLREVIFDDQPGLPPARVAKRTRRQPRLGREFPCSISAAQGVDPESAGASGSLRKEPQCPCRRQAKSGSLSHRRKHRQGSRGRCPRSPEPHRRPRHARRAGSCSPRVTA